MTSFNNGLKVNIIKGASAETITSAVASCLASKNIAIEKANEASISANSAESIASMLTTQASISTTQASVATTQATIATTKANESAGSASSALISKTNAATSEANALSYKDSASTSATIAITKANEALGYRDAALTYQYGAESAYSSTLSLVNNLELPSVTHTVDTVDDFGTIPNGIYTVIVKDINRGGTFIYDATQSAVNNGGTVFDGWVRQYSGAVNVKWFGADDVSVVPDSTSAIQNTLNFISANNGGEIVFDFAKTYAISGILSCGLNDNGILKINGNNSTIHLTSNLDYLYTGVLTIGTSTANNTSAEVNKLNWDLDGVTLDWSAINPNGGKGCILFYTRKVIVTECNYKNITYSACVWSEYANNVDISDCTGLNVGARSADNTEDARGDAFYLGRLGYQDLLGDIATDAVVNISNCVVRAHTAVPNVFINKNSAHCGRCGVTIEGSNKSSKKIVNVNNCYFYNYNRGVHVENMSNLSLNVNNTIFEEYGLGVWVFRDTELSNIKIDTCTFSRTLNIEVPNDNTQGGAGGYVIETVRNGSTNKITMDNCNIIVRPSGGTNIRLFGNIYNLVVSNSTIKLGNLPIIYNAENLKLSNCDITWTGKLDCNISRISIYDSRLSAVGSTTTGNLLIRPTSTFNSDEPIIIDKCSFEDVSVKISSTTNKSKVIFSKSDFKFSSSYIQEIGDYATSISNINKEEATISECTFVNKTVTRMTAHQQGPIRNFTGNTVIDMYLRLAASSVPLHIDNNSFIIKTSLGYSYYIDAYLSNAMISNNTFKAHVAGLGSIQNIANSLSVVNTYKIDELDAITLVVKP